MCGERGGTKDRTLITQWSGSWRDARGPLLIVHRLRCFRPVQGTLHTSLAVQCGDVTAFSSVGCRGQCSAPPQPGYALSPSGLHTPGWQSPKVVMRPGGCPRGQYSGTWKTLEFISSPDNRVPADLCSLGTGGRNFTSLRTCLFYFIYFK